MSKIINFFVGLIGETIGKWHWPWVGKKVPLKDFFLLEKILQDLESPFVVGCVKTNGYASNWLINFANLFGKKKKQVMCPITHVFAHIGIYHGYSHRVVESIGEGGVREVSFLKAVGQKDRLILRKPNSKFINHLVCQYAIEYIKAVAERDAVVGIKYDTIHDYTVIPIEEMRNYSVKNIRLDCSETIMQALEHGFKMTGQKSLVHMAKRGGKSTFVPADVLDSELFINIYDSKKGLS